MKVLIVDGSRLVQIRLQKSTLEIDGASRFSQDFDTNEAKAVTLYVNPGTSTLDLAIPEGSGIDLLRIFKADMPDVQLAVINSMPEFNI